MEEKEEKGTNGKRYNQRVKTYVLMQYLLRHTDKQPDVRKSGKTALLPPTGVSKGDEFLAQRRYKQD